MKQRNIPSHKKMMAIDVLSNEIGNSWDDEQAPLCLVAWDIKAEQSKFQQWVNRNKETFPSKGWDSCAGIDAGNPMIQQASWLKDAVKF